MTIDEVIEAIGVKPFHREPAGVKKTLTQENYFGIFSI